MMIGSRSYKFLAKDFSPAYLVNHLVADYASLMMTYSAYKRRAYSASWRRADSALWFMITPIENEDAGLDSSSVNSMATNRFQLSHKSSYWHRRDLSSSRGTVATNPRAQIPASFT